MAKQRRRETAGGDLGGAAVLEHELTDETSADNQRPEDPGRQDRQDLAQPERPEDPGSTAHVAIDAPAGSLAGSGVALSPPRDIVDRALAAKVELVDRDMIRYRELLMLGTDGGEREAQELATLARALGRDMVRDRQILSDAAGLYALADRYLAAAKGHHEALMRHNEVVRQTKAERKVMEESFYQRVRKARSEVHQREVELRRAEDAKVKLTNLRASAGGLIE